MLFPCRQFRIGGTHVSVARRRGMKLAILETGRPPGDSSTRFGDYPAMFGPMLGDGFEIENFDVAARRVARKAGRS